MPIRRLSLLVAAAITAAGVGYVLQSEAQPPSSAHLPAGLVANAQALGNGDLAFVSHGTLRVLDAARGTVRAPKGHPGWSPSMPEYSRDGRWLAYLESGTATYDNQYSAPDELWIASADGSDARQVDSAHVGNLQMIGWSPSNDTLAVIVDTTPGYQPSTALDVVTPGGSVHRLVASAQQQSKEVATKWMAPPPGTIDSAAWSPNGDQLAVGIVSFAGGGSTIRAYPVSGGSPTTWFAISGSAQLPGLCTECGGGQTIVQLAGWWRDSGIGFWVFSSGMTHNNDQTPVELLATPGAAPRIIASTLSDGTTDAVAASPGGSLAVVDDPHNGGRQFTAGKAVETCDRSGVCTEVPDADIWATTYRGCFYCDQGEASPGTPGSGVSVDPNWSANGDTVAFVRAPDLTVSVAPEVPWLAAGRLYEYTPSTNTEVEVPGGAGASFPQWSADGRRLLFVADDRLFVMPVSGGTPTEVAGPLLAEVSGYYGQVPWSAQFAWSGTAWSA